MRATKPIEDPVIVPAIERLPKRSCTGVTAIGSFPPTVLEIATPEWQSLIKFGLYTGQRLRPHRSHEGTGKKGRNTLRDTNDLSFHQGAIVRSQFARTLRSSDGCTISFRNGSIAAM